MTINYIEEFNNELILSAQKEAKEEFDKYKSKSKKINVNTVNTKNNETLNTSDQTLTTSNQTLKIINKNTLKL